MRFIDSAPAKWLAGKMVSKISMLGLWSVEWEHFASADFQSVQGKILPIVNVNYRNMPIAARIRCSLRQTTLAFCLYRYRSNVIKRLADFLVEG